MKYDIAFWHWMYHHFEADRLELDSRRIAGEIVKTAAVLCIAIVVLCIYI